MVEWGFSYHSLISMPAHEFYYYIRLLNDHRRKEKSASSKGSDAPHDPKPIGSVIPRG